jgi:subtilase family serine protease
MTKHSKPLAMIIGCATLALATGASAAGDDGEKLIRTARGLVIVPASSAARPEDTGLRAHTNIQLLMPDGLRAADAQPKGGYETPASLACVYGLVPATRGCNPTKITAVATGGSKTIAIVDAYDDPNAASDLAVFSSQYGLPAITANNFQVVYAAGARPRKDPTGGWELEESLDIEMAHALAPNAKIILVEAQSSGNGHLIEAEKVAARMVSAAGGGEVSNSWGGAEFASETNYEPAFSAQGVVFFASSGDTPGTEMPSVFSNVVAVGGTSLNRTLTGQYYNQSAWTYAGGGASQYVARPSYQDAIKAVLGPMRGVPDVALVADPATGVWVYDTNQYEGLIYDWLVIGGTSVAAPATAAIVNNAGHFFASSALELAEVYVSRNKRADFTDVTEGYCANGPDRTLLYARKGWDFCTGGGTAFGTGGK